MAGVWFVDSSYLLFSSLGGWALFVCLRALCLLCVILVIVFCIELFFELFTLIVVVEGVWRLLLGVCVLGDIV